MNFLGVQKLYSVAIFYFFLCHFYFLSFFHSIFISKKPFQIFKIWCWPDRIHSQVEWVIQFYYIAKLIFNKSLLLGLPHLLRQTYLRTGNIFLPQLEDNIWASIRISFHEPGELSFSPQQMITFRDFPMNMEYHPENKRTYMNL